jgi:hypothetical protein
LLAELAQRGIARNVVDQAAILYGRNRDRDQRFDRRALGFKERQNFGWDAGRATVRDSPRCVA